jgi:hypothetical protein
MNLPEGTRLEYIVTDEAWYAEAAYKGMRDHHPEINVRAGSSDGGVAWKFMIEEHDFSNSRPGRHSTAVRVMVFGDALDAFVDVPELFTALRDGKPENLIHVRRILDQLGAADATERESPYPAPPKVEAGDRAYLSYAYESTPAGRRVEALASPDEDGMVRVRFTDEFWVSADDLTA